MGTFESLSTPTNDVYLLTILAETLTNTISDFLSEKKNHCCVKQKTFISYTKFDMTTYTFGLY
jgi:hypothetical protein